METVNFIRIAPLRSTIYFPPDEYSYWTDKTIAELVDKIIAQRRQK